MKRGMAFKNFFITSWIFSKIETRCQVTALDASVTEDAFADADMFHYRTELNKAHLLQD